ncbi:alpha/beta fold hydrolase [Candidatus Daviesbacteria bacterium]|nr:alpha/beta fold hydrolase [Candidatus Daviesbacteria bacterium]
MSEFVKTNVVDIHTTDGLVLKGDFGKVNGSRAGIILAHGITTNRGRESVLVSAEQVLNQARFSTLRFDFRGHGARQANSETEVRINGMLIDLSATVDFMSREGIKKLGLVGASLGGAIAALYSADNPDLIQALFLENPVLDFKPVYIDPRTAWGQEFFGNIEERTRETGFLEVGSGKFRLGKELFEQMQLYNPADALVRYPNEIMVVHGDQDRRIDLKDVVEPFERLPNPRKRLEILTGAEHGFHNEPYRGIVVAMMVDFFNENL